MDLFNVTDSTPQLSESFIRNALLVGNVFYVLQIVLGVAIIIANSVIIFLFAKHEFLKSKPNIFLFSLCLADLMCGVTSLHTGISNLLRHQPMNEIPCMLAVFLQILNFGLSLYCMAGVTCVNYIKIAHPYIYGRFEESYAHLVVMIITWILVILVAGILMIDDKWKPGNECYLLPNTNQTLSTMLVMPQVVILLVMITFLFIRILLIARRQRRQIGPVVVQQSPTVSAQVGGIEINQQGHGNAAGSNVGDQNRKGTRLVLWLVTMMYICWTPLLVVFIVRSVLRERPASLAWVIYYEIGNLVTISNSLWNPFLLQMLAPNMKKAFRMTFKLRIHQET